jgi:F-type H+-transporting ATPase subunit alpha
MDVVNQVAIIYAANKGYLDGYELSVIGRYKKELLEYLHSSHAKLVEDIVKKRALDSELETQLQHALKHFGEVFDAKKS